MKLASTLHTNGLTSSFHFASFTRKPISSGFIRCPKYNQVVTPFSRKSGQENEASTSEGDAADDQKIRINLDKRVVVVGGTGRVGGSTAIALSKFCPDIHITIAGRNMDKGAAMVAKLGDKSKFSEVNLNDTSALEATLADADLVIHAAGPFQRAEQCTVLEAAIRTKTAYLDVCDDTTYAWLAKSFTNKALDANIPAITTGGIYPGVSNVMAAELIRASKRETDSQPERLRFYYYTAGSGGAGPTILATSFLLLGEEVIAYNKGAKTKLKPYSGMLNINFGNGIGKKDVYLLNLPEVRSAHEILGVPTVSARFGTDPFFWNWGMLAMTNLFPIEFFQDRSKVNQLVKLFDPWVRAVDGIAGERVSMRVDLETADGNNRIGIFSHKSLSTSVGVATAAFALAILEGSTKPGVWFPEEPEGIAVDARELLLQRAATGTINFVMNKAPWMDTPTNNIEKVYQCGSIKNMGRATRWLKGLFGMNKKKGNFSTLKHTSGLSQNLRIMPPDITPAEAAWLRSFYEDDSNSSDSEQRKQAIAVAAATAAAADAAIAAAQAAAVVVRLSSQGRGAILKGCKENRAAVKIQTIFRSYLARKALKALRGVVKLQAIVRGFLARKQAHAKLVIMEALTRAQTNAHAQKCRGLIPNHDLCPPQSQPRKSSGNCDDLKIEHRVLPRHSRRLSSSFEISNVMKDVDECPKIVEVDTIRPKSRNRCKPSATLSGPLDDLAYNHTTPDRWNFNQSFECKEHMLAGNECRLSTAQTSSCFGNSCVSNAPLTPKKSVCVDGYSGNLARSYMASTQSFKAKLRSQSAPKQRPEPTSRRRLSLEKMESRSSLSGLRRQRSCSHAPEVINFKNAVSRKLGRSCDFVNEQVKDYYS